MTTQSKSLDGMHHGLLTRMFLRQCAFLMQLYGWKGPERTWYYAALGLEITIFSYAWFLLVLIASFLPGSFNYSALPEHVVMIAIFAAGIAVFTYVQRVFRPFKSDMAVVDAYMTKSEKRKFVFQFLSVLGCVIGVSILSWWKLSPQ